MKQKIHPYRANVDTQDLTMQHISFNCTHEQEAVRCQTQTRYKTFTALCILQLKIKKDSQQAPCS